MNYTSKQINFLCSVFISFSSLALHYERRLVTTLASTITMPEKVAQDLYSLASLQELNLTSSVLQTQEQLPLFDAFPDLRNKLAYIKLGDLPTPVTKAQALGDSLGIKSLYIKRDDVSGKLVGEKHLYGGNKVRKLEFLLADALSYNAQTVMTFGGAGSNHVVATSTYAQQVGLKSIGVLRPQYNSSVVRRNLLLNLQAEAQLLYAPTPELKNIVTVSEFLQQKQRSGRFPYVIPVGGSCPLGVLGFVNAAYELKQQILKGLMPEPDSIYVSVGSCGTYVGLLIGLKAAGLKSKLIGVIIEPEEYENDFVLKILKLTQETQTLLKSYQIGFPEYNFTQQDINLVYAACGKEYALFTQEAQEALALVYAQEKVLLDGVYSAKAFLGLIQENKIKPHYNQVVLFWNTFCCDDFDSGSFSQDYKKLPYVLHDYFEKPVQNFDVTL